MKDKSNRITETEREELEYYSSLLFHNTIIKDKSWEYENEYILLFPKMIEENFTTITTGALIPMDILGIKPTGIYLGMSCDKISCAKLTKVTEKLRINLYKMNFDYTSDKYRLTYKKIC